MTLTGFSSRPIVSINACCSAENESWGKTRVVDLGMNTLLWFEGQPSFERACLAYTFGRVANGRLAREVER